MTQRASASLSSSFVLGSVQWYSKLCLPFQLLNGEYERNPHSLANGKIGEYDFSRADSIIDLALEKGLRILGHSLLWSSLLSRLKSPGMDKNLKQYKKHKREIILDSLIHEHITNVFNPLKK